MLKIGYFLPGSAISGGVKVVTEHVFLLNKIPGIKAYLISPEGYPTWTELKVPFIREKENVEDIVRDLHIVITTFYSQKYIINAARKYRKAHIHFCQGYEEKYVSDDETLRNKIRLFYSSVLYAMTVNNYVKRQLELNYPNISASVIGQPLNRNTFRPMKAAKKEYILVIGHSMYPFKGVDRSLKLATELKLLFPKYKILRVNPIPMRQQEARWGIINMYLHNLTPSQMAFIYNKSVLTVYLPREEGFGLPLIESAACGTPVIASDIEPFREVSGNLVPLFDPETEWQKMLDFAIQILQNKDLYENLRITFLSLAKNYSYAQLTKRLLPTITKYYAKYYLFTSTI